MIARELGARINALRIEDLPSEVLETAKEGVLDTVGVALAGSGADCVEALAAALGPGADGPCVVLGRRDRRNALDASLINGTAAHALDYDDCSNTMGGHPSSPIVPAIWAIAEERGASGRDLLTAYVAGVETETKIGRAVNFHHYDKGWHPTATLGTFGSAAACARLLGLPQEQVANALALAASMAAGLKANFGTMAKPFHVGQSARNGLLAARLAAAGMTASADALEHPQGFFQVFNGAGTFSAEAVLDTWAAPLDLADPGIAFKRHPCCASAHPAVDALLSLREAHGITAADVVEIVSHTHPRRLSHTDRTDPRNGLEGKFSIQYVLARALLEGHIALDHFTDAAVSDPVVRDVMARIKAAPHPEGRMESAEHFFAEVLVRTRDGRQLRACVDRPVGRDRDHPLPPGALDRKFVDCAAQAIDTSSALAAVMVIRALESVSDIRNVSRLLAGRTSLPAPARAVTTEAVRSP
jgi:2-methylcitrate dehydratase PrpD